MFVQIIQGRTQDAAGLRTQFDRWMQDLAPGAEGWLGATSGVAENGEFFSAVRFSSQEAARRNSDRPQQGAWWAEASKYLEGEVTFHDCTDVEARLGGPSPQAGFVQVIQGRVSDRDRFEELDRRFTEQIPDHRPDVIGSLIAWHEDGESFSEVVYFTDEAAAREGESQQRPAELEAAFEEFIALTEDLGYLDLKTPWHFQA